MKKMHVQFDCSGVNWNIVLEMLKQAGMAYIDANSHKQAFENSQVVVFVYKNDILIGFGRAISDNTYQAAIYDVVVRPEFQKKGIGKAIVKHILERLPQCNFVLYASPGKEDFYKIFGFRKMNTGMALFKKANEMRTRGVTE